MKRLVAVNRWRDSWFMELNPCAKLLLSYIYDTCDESGTIDVNWNLWVAQLKMDKPLIIESLKELQPKLLSDKKNKLFIIDFLKHQEKLPLVSGRKEDDSIISKLESNLPKFNNAPEIKKMLDGIKDVKELEKIDESKSKKKRVSNPFVVPTFEELKEYYLSEKPDAELSAIQDIYDHYVGCGWVVGKDKPMKDWKACVRRAIRNNEKFKKNGNYNNSQNGQVKKSRTEMVLGSVDRAIKKNHGEQ